MELARARTPREIEIYLRNVSAQTESHPDDAQWIGCDIYPSDSAKKFSARQRATSGIFACDSKRFIA